MIYHTSYRIYQTSYRIYHTPHISYIIFHMINIKWNIYICIMYVYMCACVMDNWHITMYMFWLLYICSVYISMKYASMLSTCWTHFRIQTTHRTRHKQRNFQGSLDFDSSLVIFHFKLRDSTIKSTKNCMAFLWTKSWGYSTWNPKFNQFKNGWKGGFHPSFNIKI